MRDIEANPYTTDEKRVVDFIWERGAGGGDDPIGFILASYAYLVEKRKELRKPITMSDIRLVAGEGKLSASDVLAAANAVLRTRGGM